MNLVRRFARPSLAALGVVIATAVMNLGPTARAGYQPVAGPVAAGVGLDDDSGPAPHQQSPGDPDDSPAIQARDGSSGGSMAPVPSAAGGHGSSAGFVLPAEVPPANLVVYLRQSADRLDLAAYSTSILDPPRAC